MLYILAPVPHADAAVLGNFEIDGDQSSPAGGTVDWVDFKNSSTLTVLTDKISPDDGLQGSSKEDEPEDFVCQDKSPTVTPGKDNLVRAYVNTRVAAQDSIFLDLAFVRSDGGTQGDSHVNFEFNQNKTSGLCPYLGRTDGDLLVVFDFPGNSGGSATIQTFRWDADAPDGSDNPGKWVAFNFTGSVQASDNASAITDEVVGGSIAQRAFGEATLDLVELAKDSGTADDGCASFGFASIRSRSSGQSFAAALQDIMGGPVDVTTCGKVIINKTDDAGHALAGATFGLWPSNVNVPAVGANGTRPSTGSVGTCTSLADGTCTIDSVNPGDYKVAEISAPAGHALDPTVSSISVGFRETVTVQHTFVDPLDTGTVRVTKAVTSNGQPFAIDPADLAGLTFQLEKNGQPVTTWPPPGSPAQCSLNGSSLFCDIGPVPLGTYTVTEDPNTLPDGMSQGPDQTVTVDEDGETVPVTITNPLNPINIHLDKAGPDTANVGDTITYTFDVTTTGQPLTITQLVELVDLPNNYDDRCDAQALTGPTKSGGDQDALLEVGETWHWTCKHLVTMADATDGDGTLLQNKAEVTGKDKFDRTVSDDDTHIVTILLPDLQVQKLAADGVDAGTADSHSETVDAPGTATYKVTVTNIGTGIARNATLTDTLPAGSWTVALAAGDGDDICPVGGNPKSGSFTCTFGDLAPNASKTVTVSRSVTLANDCAATLTNGASVATSFGGADLDLNAANDSDSAAITVRCPDVGVTKSATNSPVSAGQAIQWSITVTNFGAGVATDVHLRDPQPEQVGPMQLSGPDAAACGFDSGDLVCDFGDLPPNDGAPGGADTRTVTVTTATTQADCGVVPNTATLKDAQGAAYVDSNASNNSSTANATVLCPDLHIAKSADKTVVDAGDQVGFTITVSNGSAPGTGTALGVTLNDPLPTGNGVSWSIQSQTNISGCSLAGAAPGVQTLSCGPVDLAPGASFSVHVVSGTNPTGAECVGGTLPNLATADASNDDPVTANASITVQCPDLHITKTADHTVVSAGDQVGFVVTVSNGSSAGTGTAKAVTLNDPLPSGDGISWSIASQSGGAACAINGSSPQTLTCGPKDLAPGASFSVHVVSGTTPTGAECVGGTLPNLATADASNDAPVTANATITVQCPNVVITKVADDTSVSAGEDIGFVITVSNSGPGVAKGVTLNDPLPDGVDWAIVGQTGGAGCAINAQVLSCGPIDLAAGGPGFSVHIKAPTTDLDCALYENTATADSANDGPVTASDDTLVKCPGLNITKDADDPETVSAGDPIGFVITVSNEEGDGVGTALGVTLDDPLPAGDGIDWTIEDSSGASCTIEGDAPTQVLKCGPVDLDPGDSFTVHVVSDTDPSDVECTEATLPNTATADGTNTSPKQASDSVTIQCPNLQMTKLADADQVDAGEDIGFTVTLHNAGLGDAHDVVLTDPLPSSPGVVWAVTPDVEGCSIVLNLLTCEVGDLGPGGSFSVHVSATTPSELGDPDLVPACKVYDNTATATPSNDAPTSASDSTEVLCPLDITIVKDGPATAHRGDQITYTFDVTNSGAADLVKVELTDPICDEGTLTLVDDADGDTVLSVGETWSYECTRVIREDDPDPLPNTAVVLGTDSHDRTTTDSDDHLVDILNPEIFSTLTPECVENVPVLTYSLTTKDVSQEAIDKGAKITFVNPNGDDVVYSGLPLSGRVLWPGAVVDANGEPVDWPGWTETASGQWVKGDEFDWAVPTVDVHIEINPELNAPVAYPAANDECNPPTVVLGEVIEPLPKTGFDADRWLILAGLLLMVGGALVLTGDPRRRQAG